MKVTRSVKTPPQINLTSLIDILFILIIFFSVTTRFKNEMGLDVDLPKSKFSKNVAQEKALTIYMKKGNQIQINGKKYRLIELEKNFGILKSNLLSYKAHVLKIDKQVEHGSVIRLLDILKKNGIPKISFAVQK